MTLTIGIITKDEEDNIGDCIASARAIADEIVVVDDYSKDSTEKIARQAGAVVFKRKLDDFSSQKNYLINQSHSDWLLILDADERIEDSLAAEIRKILVKPLHEGYEIERKNFIFGKLLTHGGNGNDWTSRLFNSKKVKFVNEVHEKAVVSGSMDRLTRGTIIHYSTPDMSTYVKKLNSYTDFESRMIKNRKNLFWKLIFHPPFEFIKRYIYQRGFLDGMEGFVYAVLCAVYKFVKYAKAMV